MATSLKKPHQAENFKKHNIKQISNIEIIQDAHIWNLFYFVYLWTRWHCRWIWIWSFSLLVCQRLLARNVCQWVSRLEFRHVYDFHSILGHVNPLEIVVSQFFAIVYIDFAEFTDLITMTYSMCAIPNVSKQKMAWKYMTN